MLKPGTSVDPVEKVRAAWGDDAPEEVVALAEACRELGTQTKAARKLGYSNTVVSQVLGQKYEGSYPEVYARVRASFMREAVTCPALGPITGAECATNQRVIDPLTVQQVRVYRACREGCPHSSLAPYPHVKRRMGAQNRETDHVE